MVTASGKLVAFAVASVAIATTAAARPIATSTGQLIETGSSSAASSGSTTTASSSSAASDQVAHNKLGFRLALGRLPLPDGDAPFTFGLGLGLEHPILSSWKAIAEYEWIWLMEREPYGQRNLTLVGHGHRVHAGLRRALVDKRALHEWVKLFVDVELGGGMGIASADAVQLLPHGFVGLRAGYRIASDHARSSQSIEAELHLRAIATADGAALAFGVGWAWGD